MPKPKIIINPHQNPDLTKKKSTAPILRSYYWPFFFGAVPLMILIVVFAFFFQNLLPPVIPLFGAQREAAMILADKRQLFLIPIISVSINVIHALVIYFGRKYDTLILMIFAVATILVQLLLLAVLLRTVLVVL